MQIVAPRLSLGPKAVCRGPGASAKCQKIQLNTCLLNIKLPKYYLVGGYVGLVVGAKGVLFVKVCIFHYHKMHIYLMLGNGFVISFCNLYLKFFSYFKMPCQ